MNVGYDVEESTNVKRVHGWTGKRVEREVEMRKKWNKDGQIRRHRDEVRAGVSEAGVGAMGSGPEAQGKGNVTGQMIAMIRIFGINLRGILTLVLACATLRQILVISAMRVPWVAILQVSLSNR